MGKDLLACLRCFIFLLWLITDFSKDQAFGEPTPNEILMSATKLHCTFKEGVATRWTTEGPISEKGKFDKEFYTFDLIDHRLGKARSGDTTRNVQMSRSPWELTFYFVDDKNRLIPVSIISIFDNYQAGTTNFFSVLSRQGTMRNFGGNHAAQLFGTCKANQARQEANILNLLFLNLWEKASANVHPPNRQANLECCQEGWRSQREAEPGFPPTRE